MVIGDELYLHYGSFHQGFNLNILNITEKGTVARIRHLDEILTHSFSRNNWPDKVHFQVRTYKKMIYTQTWNTTCRA